MPGFPGAGYRLMIVDDDEMARQVLRLLAMRLGFAVEDVGSGAAALERLSAGGEPPQAVLADMHMPGPAGATFAWLARAACGGGTVLIAMSASEIGAAQRAGYDTFLRKPFSMEQMCAALEGAGAARTKGVAERAEVLKTTVVEELQETMGRAKVWELYMVFLADAEVRLTTLRKAAEAQDDDGWRGAAHQLKGSCGMVGAAEMAGLAGVWEARGLPGSDDVDPFKEVEAALARLRRALTAQLP